MSLEPGKYLAHATDVAYGIAKTGTDQIAVTFAIDTEGHETESITWIGSLTEKAAPMVCKALRACGWKGVDIGDVTVADLTEQVELVLDEEEDQEGNPRLRVKWVNKPGGGQFAFATPMQDKQKAALNARFRSIASGTLNGAKPESKKSAAPARPPGRDAYGSPPDDSDVPF